MLPEVRTVTDKVEAALLVMGMVPAVSALPRLVNVVLKELESRTPLPMVERSSCRIVVPLVNEVTHVCVALLQLKLICWFRLMASTRASWHMLTIVRAARLRLAWGNHFIRAVPDKPARIPIIATITKTSTKEKPLGCDVVFR
jgi:hypothetical protein